MRPQTALVLVQYQSFLGRRVDAPSLRFWVNKLSRGFRREDFDVTLLVFERVLRQQQLNAVGYASLAGFADTDVQPDVEHGRGVRERSARHHVGARLGVAPHRSRSVMPPDTSSSAAVGFRRAACSSAMATQAMTSSGVMLSSSTASAPASAPPRPVRCDRLRRGPSAAGPCRPRPADRLVDAEHAQVVVLEHHPVAEVARWLTPPPARTAAFSSARRPGSSCGCPTPASRGPAASTNARVMVAMPDR